MDRRTFFKTVAATLTAGTVAVVAPAVAAKKPGLDKTPMCFYRGRLYFVGAQDAIQTWTFSRQYDLSDWKGQPSKTL